MFRLCKTFLNTTTTATTTKLNPVNCVNLVGVVHDIKGGYAGSELSLEFMLVCNYLPISNETPLINPLEKDSSSGLKSTTPSSSSNTSSVSSGGAVEREYFTIRASGYLDELKTKLHDGAVVSVQGQFKMNIQPDPKASHKPQPYPYVNVRLCMMEDEGKSTEKKSPSSTDFVKILHSGKQKK